MRALAVAGCLILAAGIFGQERDRRDSGNTQDLYADAPEWYKPGHPVEPADASAVRTLEGFVAERVLTVPRKLGSWTALTLDSRGRLIAAAQNRPGLFRVTPARIGEPGSETRVEPLRGTAERIGWSHGLLYAFDSLYVMVSEGGARLRRGIHRLRDTDGDDQFDTLELVFRLEGDGEHGPHNMVVSPDGRSITVIAGNGTRAPDDVRRWRVARTEGGDHLMPPGFTSTEQSTEGWVCRFDPDGGNRELISSGLRNSFDLAYNRHGELFTFDSDMEPDIGAPWYRPTRICHLVSGGEFGWRDESGVWPEYYPDAVPTVVNVGPASPTGLTFGYGARFPARYQRALYACDWTFGTIHAVHLRPRGAGYEATLEEFVGGRALPVTDAVIGGDGALYFIVGGRQLTSALYRIRYAGVEPTAPAEDLDSPEARQPRALRSRLEEYHGRKDAGAVEAAWPSLGHSDPMIRYAARVAVEHQPVETWSGRALAETDLSRKITALLALARQGDEKDQPEVIRSLAAVDFASSSDERKLAVLRIYELAFARGEGRTRPLAAEVVARLDGALPDPDGPVNRELARLLCFLRAPNVVERLVAMMEADAGHPETLGKSYYARNDKYGKVVAGMLEAAPMTHRMHLAQMLIWADRGWTDELRRRYFQLIADGLELSEGGLSYEKFWERTREHALRAVPRDLRGRMEAIRSKAGRARIDPSTLPKARGPGRAWTAGGILAEVGEGLAGRDFENGRRMYAAASCVVCHRLREEGGTVGPRLMGLGARFALRDMVEAIVEPSKVISDQYRMVQIRRKNGDVVAGRVSFREAGTYHLLPDMLRSGETLSVRAGEIDAVRTLETSPMPTRLLDALNREEVLDLIAYLVSDGDPDHAVFRR
jgi:putative heme-binding domain-containing protein